VGCQGLSSAGRGLARCVVSETRCGVVNVVVWSMWLCGLQPEGPVVLCSQERSGRGVGCRRVSADMWYWACGQGVWEDGFCDLCEPTG
jgi:hypothetical protein